MTENEKKQTQRIKAKQKCVKILNICCYIGTILLVLLLLLTGLTQCKGASSVSAEAEQPRVTDLSLTTWRLNDTIDVSEDFAFDINFEDEYSVNQSWYYTGFNVDDESLIYWQSNGGRTIAYDNEDRFIYTPEAQTITINDGDDARNADLIDYLYDNGTLLTDLTTFTFNKQFNYNGPLGLNVSNYFGSSTTIATPVGSVYRIFINIGVFVSNGKQYDQIVVDYLNAGGCYYVINSILTLGTSGELSYFALGYRIKGTNTYDFVNYRDQSQYVKSGETPKTYQESSSTWVNDSWRYLSFARKLTNDETITLNKFNNNNQYTPADIGTADANVFNLFSNVFTSIAPILSIMILPNITIGMLVFIPLVASLIFFIIHIIKK